MSNNRYSQYAADCMRLAENETSAEAKTVMLNMALCWLRLAQQVHAVAATLAPHSAPESFDPEILEAVKPAERQH